MDVDSDNLHFVTFVRSLISLFGLLVVCVALSGCKTRTLNAGALSESSKSEDEFQDCRDFSKGLPLLIAYAPGAGTQVTQWWRRFALENVQLGNGLDVEVEIMGAETTQGLPENLRHRIEPQESSFVNVCNRVASQEAERRIDESLKFVFEIYRNRYGFADKQINTFAGEAAFAIRTSVYLTVRRRSDREILGTVRLVRSPYGRRYVEDKATGAIIADHSGSFGPAVEKMLPFEIERRQSGASSDLEFPEADRYRYELDIKQPSTTLGPDIRFYEFTDRSKPIANGEFRPLPLEMALRVKLPREAPGRVSVRESNDAITVHYSTGELIELGIFAVAKSAPAEVKQEIFRQFAALVAKLSKDQHVVLWGTTKYPRLYSSMGFQIFGEPFVAKNVKQSVIRVEAKEFVQRVSALADAENAQAVVQGSSANERNEFLKQIDEVEKDVSSGHRDRLPE
jgi:hypothetical protein